MKFKILFLLVLFVQGFMYSQISVGNLYFPQVRVKSGRLPEELLASLKATTTLFVIRNKDKNKLEDFKTAFQNTWSFNPLKVISQSEIGKYEGKPGYSFITVSAYINTGSVNAVDFFLEYWLPVLKREEKSKETISLIQLYSDDASQSAIVSLRYADGLKELAPTTNDLADFFNLTPGLAKCYLKFMNNQLDQAQPHAMCKNESNPELLYSLKKDTLCIPEYVLKSGITDAGIKENYPFPYKILDQATLDLKITKSRSNLYVLSYVFVNRSTKFITVFNAQTGEILYSYNNMEGDSSKPITEKDFSKLSKKIKGAE